MSHKSSRFIFLVISSLCLLGALSLLSLTRQAVAAQAQIRDMPQLLVSPTITVAVPSTPTPGITPTPTRPAATPTPTAQPSPTPTPTPGLTPTPTPGLTPTPSPSPSVSPTPIITTTPTTDTHGGNRTAGIALSIGLGLLGLLLLVLGIVLYSFYARQQRAAQGR